MLAAFLLSFFLMLQMNRETYAIPGSLKYVNILSEDKLRFSASWSKKFCKWNIPLEISRKGYDNKIIGMAMGPAYTFDKLVLFCKSVRQSGFLGDVLIGISKLKGVENSKRKNGIEVIFLVVLVVWEVAEWIWITNES